jgi:uncharacterized protein (TIGR02996 family)
MDEDAFIQAIAANPDCEDTRLVYADWLEERGDPRGEYTRLEVERGHAPSGRRKKVQQRLIDLRRTLDPKWVVRVGIKRLHTIDDLVYYLRYHLGKRSRAKAPGRLPNDLPRGLALIYRELPFLFGRNYWRFWKQDRLYPVGKLRRVDGMIDFLAENQGCWSCRFPIGEPDPPVFCGEGEFVKVSDSLNHFLATLLFRETVLSRPCLVLFKEGKHHNGKPAHELLLKPCRSLWIGGRYVYEDVEDFFDLPTDDTWLMDSGGLWFASQEERSLKYIRGGLPSQRIH